MLKDEMEKTTKIVLIGFLILAVICIVPALMVWTINSIAESGGSSFYLEHSLWNYFLTILFVSMFKVGNS